MKKNKQLILRTCIMLVCTLLTTIAFANNDTLNKIANDDEANFFQYDRARIQNKTQFTATVTVTYPGCKNDVFEIAPGATGSPKPRRGLCLITKIEATFATNGGASVTQITNFSSSGTSAADFAIAENATNPAQTEFECRIYRSNMEGTEIGIKPGFVIHNKINADSANRNVQLYVTINGNEILVPFGGSRQFDTHSGYFSLCFRFIEKFNSIERMGYFGQVSGGHYSGAPVLFSNATEKPTYEITGTIQTDKNNYHTVKEEICYRKTNTVGNNMMTSATNLKKCGIATFSKTEWNRY